MSRSMPVPGIFIQANTLSPHSHLWGHSRGSMGFTLMEILIAILIFSLVITTVYASFDSFMDTSLYVRTRMEDAGDIRKAMDVITNDLESLWAVLPPRYRPGSEDDDPFVFRGDEIDTQGLSASRLMFSSFHHLAFDGRESGGPVRIIYFIRKGDDGSFDLCRADSPRPFTQWDEVLCAPILLKHITAFDITYIDAGGDSFKSWDSHSDQFNFSLPATVEINLTMDGSSGKQSVKTAVSLLLKREINTHE